MMNLDGYVDVKGYEGIYMVNRQGDVYSLYRNRLLKQDVHTGGAINKTKYHTVKLCDIHKEVPRRDFYVHRLVAQAFIPNPDNKPDVNHIDGNTENNNADNLEWVTHLENMKHREKTKTDYGNRIYFSALDIACEWLAEYTKGCSKEYLKSVLLWQAIEDKKQ